MTVENIKKKLDACTKLENIFNTASYALYAMALACSGLGMAAASGQQPHEKAGTPVKILTTGGGIGAVGALTLIPIKRRTRQKRYKLQHEYNIATVVSFRTQITPAAHIKTDSPKP